MKFGVVGHGSIGRRHAANLYALGHKPEIYDPVYGAGLRFERHIYETCDAVIIANPTDLHASSIRACAERGRHMLIEKPISGYGADLGGLQTSLDLARSKGAVAMMGNNLRFHSAVQQAKAWITEGHIGKPVWAHFICAAQTEKAPYVSDGVLFNTGSHEVDMALHLLGPAKAVAATISFGLVADFMLQHENGCRSTFHLDFITPNEIREFWIAGNERNIGANLLTRTTCLGSTIHSNSGSYDDDYVAEIKAFILRIEGQETLGATADDGLETLKLLLDVRKMAPLP